MRRLATLLLVAWALVGCGQGEKAPFLGKWSGGFVVESVEPKVAIQSLERQRLRGFLILYLTDDRCTLHLEGEQEAVEVKGAWALGKHQIQIHPSDQIKIDDAGGFDSRDPNKTFIAPQDLRSSFSGLIGMTFSKDRKRLSSPPLQVGPLTGHYEFTKDTPGH